MAGPASRYLAGVNVSTYLARHPSGLYEAVENGSDLFDALYKNAALLDATAPLHEQFGHHLYLVYKDKPIHPAAATRVPGSDGRRLARRMARLMATVAEHQTAAAEAERAVWATVVQGWGEVGQKPGRRRNDIDMTR